ncbi:hypothetical protein GCM10010266_52420 [Streptomyces griseomycini]|nr:hypothetical protein GCM10010266_52420 [Streptomyces griseomycini]GGR39526.1 hypothetical protein GCM10015536_51580 [Streptomyces griseomycini]
MIRGLVRATNAMTRAPNGRWAGLWLVPSIPAGRDSTAVTHTPTEIPASLRVWDGGKGSRVPRHSRRCPDPDIRGGRVVLGAPLRGAPGSSIEHPDERLRIHLPNA